MDEALKLLEKWVIDENQCVTKTTILNRTSLNLRQIDCLMSDFYEKHRDLPLSAMYLVLGTKKQEDGSPTRHSVICKHDVLEKIKIDFEEVVSVKLYSIYRDSSTTVQTLLNANWSGKYVKPVEPIAQRLGITSEQALKALEFNLKLHYKTAYSSHVIPPFMIKGKKEPKQLAKNIVCKSSQRNLKDAFAMAAQRADVTEKMDVD